MTGLMEALVATANHLHPPLFLEGYFMPRKSLLLVPGPTPVPDSVLRASAAPMVNHRGPEFVRVLRDCVDGLHQIFATEGDVLAFPASGTGGMESAIVNMLSAGDRVLSCSVGAFGDRFAKIASRFGARVESCGFEWGESVDPDRVSEALAADPDRGIKAVLVTHNETSTGVVNNIRAVAERVREHGALLLVDAISGLIAHEIPVDDWGLDVVVAGSQKAFMIPPGLTFVSVSKKAWDAHAKATLPRFYWDYTEMKSKDLTPYTPPVSLFFALQEAVRLLLEEGLPTVRRRHAALGSACRAGVEALGLSLLAPEGSRSNSVTAVRCPKGVTVKALRSHLRDQYGATVAGGQGKLDSQIFRIGHLGYSGWTDIVGALAALEMSLYDLGLSHKLGSGVSAAMEILRQAASEVTL